MNGGGAGAKLGHAGPKRSLKWSIVFEEFSGRVIGSGRSLSAHLLSVLNLDVMARYVRKLKIKMCAYFATDPAKPFMPLREFGRNFASYSSENREKTESSRRHPNLSESLRPLNALLHNAGIFGPVSSQHTKGPFAHR